MDNDTYRSLRVIADDCGFQSVSDLLEYYVLEDIDIVPACCSEGCVVEPDGHCPHGNPSILLRAGWI